MDSEYPRDAENNLGTLREADRCELRLQRQVSSGNALMIARSGRRLDNLETAFYAGWLTIKSQSRSGKYRSQLHREHRALT
jgi:hypothetical protein